MVQQLWSPLLNFRVRVERMIDWCEMVVTRSGSTRLSCGYISYDFIRPISRRHWTILMVTWHPWAFFFPAPPPYFDSLEEMLLRTHNSPPNQTLHRESKGGILKLSLSSPTLSEHVRALSVIGKRGKVVGIGVFWNNAVRSDWLV